MLIINERQLNNFIAELKKKFDFFDVRNENLPFKKYFFPATEEIFPVPKPPKKFVIFGLDPIDLEAITQLDEIMSKPKEDFYYWQRRKQALVIGIEKDMKKLAKDYKEFFKEQEEAPVGNFVSLKTDNKGNLTETKVSDWSQSMRQILVDSELLANAVEWSKTHKIWGEITEKCLGCGICAYVCPLCYCFSLEDRISLDDKCSRCRKWDACVLPGFAKISGGHSFRPTIKERYYNWFYHKFVRAYREYGKSQCVGCGRCKNQCPAGINILEILTVILQDYRSSQ
jgi:ferredoxin